MRDQLNDVPIQIRVSRDETSLLALCRLMLLCASSILGTTAALSAVSSAPAVRRTVMPFCANIAHADV